MKNAIVSGASTGIGLCLAQQLLEQGYRVYGVSRRVPAQLADHPHYTHCVADFTDTHSASQTLQDFIVRQQITAISRLFLNVGQFGKRIAPLCNVSVPELNELMRVNVWSHKILLDCLLAQQVVIEHAVFSSSIAGVRARAGNSGYAITKAALNMLAQLYALENPSIRFSLLGLCSVQTFLSHTVGTLPLEGDFPEITKLRERARTTNYLVSAEQRAADVLALLEPDRIGQVPNGEFIEIRSLVQHA